MRKNRKILAALMAAVMTASSSVAMFSYADEVSPDTSISLPSNSSTQADALRFMLEKYIAQNNIDAWIYDKESSPEGVIMIGYYRKNENIPLEIIAQVEQKGFDPQLVNFVQEDHEKDGLIEDMETIKRIVDYYISANNINARIVPEFQLLDELDKNVLYVEYSAEKAEIPDMLSAYIKEMKIDPEFVTTGALGSFSKQAENAAEYTFEEFCKLTEDEVRALFEEKGMTAEKGYVVWTEKRIASEQKYGKVDVLLKPNPFPVSDPELEEDYKIYWEQDRFGAALGLPEELFIFKQNLKVRAGYEDGESGFVFGEYCSCTIRVKSDNSDEAAKLLAAALNYVQLSPYFVNFHYDYWGTAAAPVKGDANCDGTADMADVVLIMQALANPDRYQLSERGAKNADMDGNGLTVGDAQTIQNMLLGIN